MAEKTKQKGKDEKIAILEREYVIPLRRKFIRSAKYKRAERAIREIRKFIIRHMKIYDKDEKKVKIDKYVNEEIWFRGIKKPVGKIRIKAIKYMDNSVSVQLAEIPEAIKFKVEREERIKKEGKKKAEKKVEEKTEQQKAEQPGAEKEKAEETKEEKKEENASLEKKRKQETKEEKELEKITEEKQEKEKEEILKHETKAAEKIQAKEKQIKTKEQKTKAKKEIHKFATGR